MATKTYADTPNSTSNVNSSDLIVVQQGTGLGSAGFDQMKQTTLGALKEYMAGDPVRALTFKGSCTYALLPVNPSVGDVWNVTDRDGKFYAWNGTTWDSLGIVLDLSGKADKTYVDAALEAKADSVDVYTKTETNDLLDEKANTLDVEKYLGVDISKKRNLLSKESSIAFVRVSGTDGSLSTFHVYSSVSDYIDVGGMSHIAVSGNTTVQTSTTHKYAFFDSSYGFISGLNIGSETSAFFNGTIEVPSNAKYFRINFMPQDNVMIEEGTVATDYVPYAKPLTDVTIESYGGNDIVGYYIRFANGVQMCHGFVNADTTTLGQRSAEKSFVVPFSDVSYIMVGSMYDSFYGTNTGVPNVVNFQPYSTTSFIYMATIQRTFPTNTFSGRASYIAIGRWK